MTPEKTHGPEEPVAITMTVAEWEAVRHWLTYGADYHHAKSEEWLANCADKELAQQLDEIHKSYAARAESLAKIIEAALHPAPPPKETE